MKRIAVIGASTAGLAAAQALREEGFDGELTVVGAEPHAPYDRTLLSKDLLLGAVSRDEIASATPEELETLAVQWRLGCGARALRPREQVVELADGSTISYDGLVLATGSSARTLPFEAPAGVHALRDLDDAIALDAALGDARRVVLVGGGFIGLELAAVARRRGAEVTVVEMAEQPLAPLLGARVGAAIAARHVAAGVRFRCGARTVGFAGRPALSGVALDGGEVLPADLAIVGIGAAPNVAWLAGSGVASDAGVAADACLATAVPNVVAAGDIVRWPHPAQAHPVRIEHYEHAQLSGGAAARRLLHGEQVDPYAPVPFVWSHQFDHAVHIAGFPSPEAEIELVEGDLEDGPFVVRYARANEPIGVLAFDDPRAFRRHRRSLVPEGVAT